MATPPRSHFVKRLHALESRRAEDGFDTLFRDIGSDVVPMRPRFIETDVGRVKTKDRQNKLIDPRADEASERFAALMLAAVTSPHRPWFRFGVPGLFRDDRRSVRPLKMWLQDEERDTRAAFLGSNIYKVLPEVWRDGADFGTSAAILMRHPNSLIHMKSIPPGSFVIGTDEFDEVNTLYYRTMMSVEQIMNLGNGEERRVSRTVREQYDKGQYYHRYPVIHCIEPNDGRDPEKIDGANKPWRSVYIELSPEASNFDGLLRVSGFDRFPAVVWRWSLRDGATYSESFPGHKVLGDCRSLQQMHSDRLMLMAKAADPPLNVPGRRGGRRVNGLPGGINWTGATGVDGAQAIHDFSRARLDAFENAIQETTARIDRKYMLDVILTFLSRPGEQPLTAEESRQLSGEKQGQLAGFLSRVDPDLLRPLVNTVYDMRVSAGVFNEPPSGFEGLEFEVEFVSVLHQASEQMSLGQMDAFLLRATSGAQMDPDSLDRVNFDEIVLRANELTINDPNLVRGDEEVAARRQQRAQQQAMMQAAEQAPKVARATRDFNEVDQAAGAEA